MFFVLQEPTERLSFRHLSLPKDFQDSDGRSATSESAIYAPEAAAPYTGLSRLNHPHRE